MLLASARHNRGADAEFSGFDEAFAFDVKALFSPRYCVDCVDFIDKRII